MAARVNIGPMQFHVSFWARQWTKSELIVQSVRVPSNQDETPQTLKIWMAGYGLHQPSPQFLAAVLLQNKYVAQVRKSRLVGDYAGKADLRVAVVETEAQRPCNRTSQDLDGKTGRPIGCRKKTMNDT